MDEASPVSSLARRDLVQVPPGETVAGAARCMHEAGCSSVVVHDGGAPVGIWTESNALELDLGGLTCRIQHLGGTHTSDSSVLYIPERKVLFAGDCIYGRRFGGAYGYRLDELTRMAAQLTAYDAEHYLISHENPLSRKELTSFFDQLIEIGRIVGDEADFTWAEQQFVKAKGHAPDEEEAEMLAMFTGPNGA